jgi:hypothetical protein
MPFFASKESKEVTGPILESRRNTCKERRAALRSSRQAEVVDIMQGHSFPSTTIAK